MELLCFTGTVCILLALALATCYDTRRPMSTKIKYKFRVKDDSIFRKIIKFQDRKYFPCNYFKIIPVYVFLLLAISSLILLSIDLFTSGLITKILPENFFTIAAVCVLVISILYELTILIWWEIVDYNEFKFTKEEKEELKRLRNMRKGNKKNDR